MRAVAILALASVFATLAAAVETDETAPATQGQARALENRWKNCSQVKSGRLGAFHPEDNMGEHFQFPFQTADNTKNGTFSAHGKYAPCRSLPIGPSGEDAFLVLTNDVTDETHVFTKAVDNDQVVTFEMSKKLGQPASMEGLYKTDLGVLARVVTNCGPTNDKAEVSMDGLTYVVTLTNVNACPRFPFTNEYMPPGGIAALVIILVTFVIQMAICAWYHKTHESADAPTDATMH